jgi:hypothetical protein
LENGTGYFDHLATDKDLYKEGYTICKSVTPAGRRIIIATTPVGNIVVFERYTNVDNTNENIPVVSNVPRAIRRLMPDGAMSDDAFTGIFGWGDGCVLAYTVTGIYNDGVESVVVPKLKAIVHKLEKQNMDIRDSHGDGKSVLKLKGWSIVSDEGMRNKKPQLVAHFSGIHSVNLIEVDADGNPYVSRTSWGPTWDGNYDTIRSFWRNKRNKFNSFNVIATSDDVANDEELDIDNAERA